MRNLKTIRLVTFLAIVFLTTATNAQTKRTYNYPELPQVDISSAKVRLANLLRENYYWNSKARITSPENVAVFDDRLEITLKKEPVLILYFSDIPEIERPKYNELLLRNGKYLHFYYMGDELADYIYYFQHQLLVQKYDSLTALFKPLAAEYRALKVKPPVSEAQRRYIVQANSFNQEKVFDKAIEMYIKAIETDQTSYPAAYSNLALLSAQVKKFDAAIFYMKKYLLLVPEAEDARAAQDKIYEWETKTGGK
jgi:tetratricopeptide (TPR) repeat protein